MNQYIGKRDVTNFLAGDQEEPLDLLLSPRHSVFPFRDDVADHDDGRTGNYGVEHSRLNLGVEPETMFFIDPDGLVIGGRKIGA